jgi:hypothetical protein
LIFAYYKEREEEIGLAWNPDCTPSQVRRMVLEDEGAETANLDYRREVDST